MVLRTLAFSLQNVILLLLLLFLFTNILIHLYITLDFHIFIYFLLLFVIIRMMKDALDMQCMSNKNATISSTSSSNIGGSTSQLIKSVPNSNNLYHGFSVDSIIYDIEQNSKRLSVNLGGTNNDIEKPVIVLSSSSTENQIEMQHARLKDNRLPSINSEVFVSEIMDEVSWPFKIYWLFSSLVITLSILAIFTYWIFLFDGQTYSPLAWYLRLDRHGIASLLVIVERMSTRTPIRLLHFIYTSLLFVLYGATNATYCYTTETFVYGKLDFVGDTLRASALILLGAFVAVPVVHFFAYLCVHRLKEWASEKFNSRKI